MKKLLYLILIIGLSNSIAYSQSASKHSLQVNITPLYSFRSLTNYKDNLDQLKKFRENSDKYAYTFNAGLLYSYPISQKLSISTGFGYTVYGIDLEGDIEITTPDQPDGTGEKGEFESTLRYTYWDVPLYFNYIFLNTPKYKFTATLGGEYNYLKGAIYSGKTTLNGKVLREETFNDLENYSKSYNKENTSIVVGVSIETAISDKLSLSLQPNFRKQLESQYISEKAVFEQRQYAYGCTIGIRYSL